MEKILLMIFIIGIGIDGIRYYILHLLGYAYQSLVDRLEYGAGRHRLVGDADEGDGKAEVTIGNTIPKDGFLRPIGFSDLAFHTVAVHSMVEALLGYRDEDRGQRSSIVGWRLSIALYLHKNNSQGEYSH